MSPLAACSTDWIGTPLAHAWKGVRIPSTSLNHMVFWQDGALEWLDGGSPSMPQHASDGWPGASSPNSRAEWLRATRRFRTGLARLEHAARRAASVRKGRSKSPVEMLAGVAAHNSYHAGQAALLRQLLGKWPPPSGGLTW
jgi:uncharacterized damage-inducible protein DinB